VLERNGNALERNGNSIERNANALERNANALERNDKTIERISRLPDATRLRIVLAGVRMATPRPLALLY
jgi:hypothetical protein